MDDGFYETLLQDIKQYMQNEDYQNALALLEEEFKMPYIPKEIEEQLLPLYQECRHEIKAQKMAHKYDETDIEELLNGSIDEAFQAVELLKKSNIRRHLQIVENYLSKEPHFLIRSQLIECLVEQNINETIHIQYDGLELSVIPSYIELPANQDALTLAVKQVQEYYENDDPTFYVMCVESMLKELYLKLPFSLSEEEVNYFVYAILLYVYQAFDDKEGFKAFIHEKKLANYSGYDLLLYKYDI